MTDTTTTEPQIQQPTDVLANEPAREEPKTGTLVMHQGMDLTFRSEQEGLTPRQAAALSAVLNFDPKESDVAIAQVKAFLHLCVNRVLDPFAREAYLIARGTGGNRKYTMQVGIDGYRKIAGRTGTYLGVTETLWTGNGDAEKDWWRDDRGVMRRVWYDQWPTIKGNPGSARVTVAFYGQDGSMNLTEGVADWTMYAPESQAWHWGEQKGKKVYETNPDGSKKMELTDMWAKGGAHMLAKCAEALALRKALPAMLSGMYTHEEMQRHDAIEQTRSRATVDSAARHRIIEAQAAKVGRPVPDAAPDAGGGDGEPGEEPAMPLLPMRGDQPEEAAADVPEPRPDEDVVDAEIVHDEPVEPATVEEEPEPNNDDLARQYLIEEGRWMVTLWPDEKVADVEQMFARNIDAAGVASFEDLPLDDLAPAVMGKRVAAAGRMTEQRMRGAERYAAITRGEIGQSYVGPVNDLLGFSASA